MAKYAVYGTLRKGQGNYNRRLAGKPGVNYIETKTIPGFVMYPVSGFPGVIRGEGTIVADIFEVNNPSVERSLDALEGYSPELGAKGSWYDKQKTPDGEYIYIWQNDVSHLKPIKNGDYINPEY